MNRGVYTAEEGHWWGSKAYMARNRWPGAGPLFKRYDRENLVCLYSPPSGLVWSRNPATTTKGIMRLDEYLQHEKVSRRTENSTHAFWNDLVSKVAEGCEQSLDK